VKILLDECVDRRLGRLLIGHDVKTVPQLGWATIQNGKLLSLAAKEFDIFLTVDRNLAFQQPITEFSIGVVVLQARTNRLQDLEILIPKVLSVLREIRKGEVRFIQRG
jgi:hypothetical protein